MAMALHSFAVQGFTPHELLDVAAEHLAGRLPRYNPQSVANILWALGRLGVHPGRGLPDGGPCTPVSAGRGRACSRLLPCGCGRASVRCTARQPRTAAANTPACRSCVQDGTPLMAAVAAYGLAHAQPGSDQDSFSLQGLAMLLWSYAVLEQHPGDALLDAVSARLTAALRRLGGSAGGHNGAGGGEAETAASGEASTAGTGEQASLRVVANVAYCFARFRRMDEPFFEAVADALPALTAAHAAEQAARPAPPAPAAAAEGEAAAAAAAARGEEPHAIASLAYSVAKLRVEAAPRLLQGLLGPAQAHLPDFSVGEVCQLWWALATAGCGPAPPPLALLDAAAARVAAGAAACDARLLCMAVYAAAELRYRLPGPVLDVCLRQVAAAGDAVPASLLCKLLWGCAHVGHSPDPELLEALADDLYHRLSHARGSKTVRPSPARPACWAGLAACGGAAWPGGRASSRCYQPTTMPMVPYPLRRRCWHLQTWCCCCGRWRHCSCTAAGCTATPCSARGACRTECRARRATGACCGRPRCCTGAPRCWVVRPGGCELACARGAGRALRRLLAALQAHQSASLQAARPEPGCPAPAAHPLPSQRGAPARPRGSRRRLCNPARLDERRAGGGRRRRGRAAGL